MTTYSRTAYGSNPLAGASRNNAQARGWGPGWPNAQTDKMAVAAAAGVRLSVRREIVPLVETLLTITKALGYTLKPGACWGFANRPIRGTRTASNHSWGLAVDLNAEDNPMSYTFTSDLPPAVVHAWESCRFYWGGRYSERFDSMHFEYIGTPAQVAADATTAARLLAGITKPSRPTDVAPPKEDDDMTIEEYEEYNRRLYAPTGTLGTWRAQDRSWQTAMLNAANAQAEALRDIAAALKGQQ